MCCTLTHYQTGREIEIKKHRSNEKKSNFIFSSKKKMILIENSDRMLLKSSLLCQRLFAMYIQALYYKRKGSTSA